MVRLLGTRVDSSWDTGEGACVDLGGEERGGAVYSLECWRRKKSRWNTSLVLRPGMRLLNPLPTTANSLKKQKNMYKVLTPNIKPPI